MQISDAKIQEMFAAAVKAKVEHSTALGTKACWTMKDHLDVAAKVMEAVVSDEVDYEQIRSAMQKTYNHSAYAQKLEKAFAKFGHFQRDSRGPKESVDDVLGQLAKELGVTAAKPTPTTVPTPTPTA